VQAVTLNEALAGINGVIDLLKMDIEGSEYEVLFSAGPDLFRRVRRLNIERHDPPPGAPLDAKSLVRFIESHNFRITRRIGRNAEPPIIHAQRPP